MAPTTRLQSRRARQLLANPATVQDARRYARRLRALWDRHPAPCPICLRRRRAGEMTVKLCCFQLVCTRCCLEHVVRQYPKQPRCMFCRAQHRPRQVWDTLAAPTLFLRADISKPQEAAAWLYNRLYAYTKAAYRTGVLPHASFEELVRDLTEEARHVPRGGRGVSSLPTVVVNRDAVL